MTTGTNSAMRIAGVLGDLVVRPTAFESEGRAQAACDLCGGAGMIAIRESGRAPCYEPCECVKRDVQNRRLSQLFAKSQLGRYRQKVFGVFKLDGNRDDPSPDSPELAYAEAWKFAQEPAGRWLIFWSANKGTGKTHLAAAIANFRLDLGEAVLFQTEPDLLDALRSSYRKEGDEGYEALFDSVRSVPLLILDDLGTSARKNTGDDTVTWVDEKLFQLLDHRYRFGLPLVVTTNMQPSRYPGRLRSRLNDHELSTVIHIRARDWRA